MSMTRVKGIWSMALATACMAVMTACATAAPAEDNLFAQRSENAFDPATIDAIGDKVADWQLANLDDLSYIRNASRGQTPASSNP